MNAASVWILAGASQVTLVLEIGNVGRLIHAPHRPTRCSDERASPLALPFAGIRFVPIRETLQFFHVRL